MGSGCSEEPCRRDSVDRIKIRERRNHRGTESHDVIDIVSDAFLSGFCYDIASMAMSDDVELFSIGKFVIVDQRFKLLCRCGPRLWRITHPAIP